MEQGQEIHQGRAAPPGKRPKSKAFYIAIAGAVAVLFIVIAFETKEERASRRVDFKINPK